MYPPANFVVDDPQTLAAMLASVRLGALVTHGETGFSVTHMPFVHDAATNVLQGHVAGVNPQHGAGETQAVAIFQPAQAYVSPAYYPSKAEHGRVVPTWNYEALHVHGRLRWSRDPVWLRAHLERLTARFEAGRAAPWALADAPADYLERLIRGIAGAELVIERVEGLRKLSQNKGDPDRLGVIEGLSASADLDDRGVAAAMRALEPDPG